MTVKEYLAQAYTLDQQINSKLEQLSGIKNLAARVATASQTDRVMQTPDLSPMEKAIIKLIDLEREIDADIDRFVDTKRQIVQVINRLKQPSHRLILELRYLSYKPWDEIAGIMNYSSRNTQYLHEKALQALTQIIKDCMLFH